MAGTDKHTLRTIVKQGRQSNNDLLFVSSARSTCKDYKGLVTIKNLILQSLRIPSRE